MPVECRLFGTVALYKSLTLLAQGKSMPASMHRFVPPPDAAYDHEACMQATEAGQTLCRHREAAQVYY